MQKAATADYKIESKPKKVITSLILILLGVATGIVVGIWFVNSFMSANDFSGYSEVTLRDDEANIVAKHSNKPVAGLTSVNAFILAEHKLANSDAVTLNASGFINAAGVNQDMYTFKYKVGENYFVENISKGQVIMGIDTNIAERDYYDTTSGKVRVYKGTDIQMTSATFKEMKEELTLTEWKEKNGTTPLNFQPYIVSSKTIENATNITPCTLQNGKRGYRTDISLKYTGAYLYVRQIRNLSGLADLPAFDFIKLEVYFNDDGSFNKIIAREQYKVKKMGIPVTTTSYLEYNFTHEQSTIPTI